MRPAKRQGLLDGGHGRVIKVESRPGTMFAKMVRRTGARDWHNMIRPVDQPGDGQRRRGCSHIRRQLAKRLAGLDVGREVRFLETRIDLQEGKRVCLFRRTGTVCQQRAPDRREGDKRGAEPLRLLHKPKLWKAHSKRIFRLHRRHMMNGIGAAKRAWRDLGKSEAANLALLDQPSQRGCHLLNRDRGVAAMNIEQIDGVHTKPRKRAVEFGFQMFSAVVEGSGACFRVLGDGRLCGDAEQVVPRLSLFRKEGADHGF